MFKEDVQEIPQFAAVHRHLELRQRFSVARLEQRDPLLDRLEEPPQTPLPILIPREMRDHPTLGARTRVVRVVEIRLWVRVTW